MLCTSTLQCINVDRLDKTLTGRGRRGGPASQFKVHKVSAGGIRMFESVANPGSYIRLKDGKIDCAVGFYHFNIACIYILILCRKVANSEFNRNVQYVFVRSGIFPFKTISKIKIHLTRWILIFESVLGEKMHFVADLHTMDKYYLDNFSYKMDLDL